MSGHQDFEKGYDRGLKDGLAKTSWMPAAIEEIEKKLNRILEIEKEYPRSDAAKVNAIIARHLLNIINRHRDSK